MERPHARALVTRLVVDKPLPDEVVDHIVIKADGVPLYVEELTKTILASDILRDTGDRFELTGPLSSLSIPDTLQESLMARLDSLPQVRELAQMGSVLGREFAYEMISGLSASGDNILQDGLEQLVGAELLYQRGRPPRSRYIFKHALVQDAAYGSLLRRTRQQHHLQVAKLMETSFTDIIDSNPELAAHHYREAGETGIAAGYFLKAGSRAMAMSANNEAIAHLNAGLDLVATLPEGADRDQRELALLLPIGQALIASQGYASPDVEPTYLRALALCQRIGDQENEFLVVQGLSLVCYIRSELHKSRKLAEQLVALAKSRKDPGPDLAANRSLGYALGMLGELEASRKCFDNVTSSYDSALHDTFALLLGGSNFGVGSYGLNVWNLFALGFSDQAKESSRLGLELARKLNHPLSESLAGLCAACAHQMRGEHAEARDHANSGAGLAAEKGLVQYILWNNVPLYAARFELGEGETAENISGIVESINACRKIDSNLFNPFWQSLLARAYHQNGQINEGLITIAEALAEVAKTDERLWEAELLRIKGQLLLEGDSTNVLEAESSFRKSIEVAQSQNAKGWELRAVTNLAGLWFDQGNGDDARELLLPVYNWFTEGFESADYVAAKALLDELG